MSSSSSNDKHYHLTPKEIEILKWKDAKRLELRETYLREVHHPTKHQLCDEGVLRFGEMRLTHGKRGVYNFKSFQPFLATGAVFFFLLAWARKTRREREHLYRTGQVSYADREYKFH